MSSAVETVGLVSGNVVVSVDHFKRFLAGLRNIVGGRLKAYETILDSASTKISAANSEGK